MVERMKRLVIFLFLGLSSCLYSQGVKLFSHEQNFPSQAVLRASLLPGAGISLETSIFKNITLKNEIFLEPNFAWETDLYTLKNKLVYYPTISYMGAVRYYYNFSKRKKREKNINNFSGNYLAIQLRIPINDNTFISKYSGVLLIRTVKLKFLWGIQRSTKNLKWNYGFAVGAFREFDNREYHPDNNKPWFLYPAVYANFAYNIFSYTNKHSAK